MKLIVERFEQDATGIHEGPVFQVSDEVRFFTFGEQRYADLSGADLLDMFRAEGDTDDE